MSYDIRLRDPMSKKILTVALHTEGGRFDDNGTTETHLNITDNYVEVYDMLSHMQGMRALAAWGGDFKLSYLHAKKADDTIPMLQTAVDVLGVDRYQDYYAPTPGNAGYALSVLLEWAQMYPGGVWEVSR